MSTSFIVCIFSFAEFFTGATFLTIGFWRIKPRMMSVGLFFISTFPFTMGPSNSVTITNATLLTVMVFGFVSAIFWSFCGNLARPGHLGQPPLSAEDIASVNTSASVSGSITMLLGVAASILPPKDQGYGKAGSLYILAFAIFIFSLPNISRSMEMVARNWHHISVRSEVFRRINIEKLIYVLIPIGFAASFAGSNIKAVAERLISR